MGNINGGSEFAEFVAAYPKCRRNTSKRDALKAWNQAMARSVTPEAIMATLHERIANDWRACGPEGCFHPYMATFLRGESFAPAEPDMPLFVAADRVDDFWTRAEALRDRWLVELGQWEVEMRQHQHGYKCHYGEVCAYIEAKRPHIPTIEEIVERLKA